MRDKQFNRILKRGRKFNCSKCPIPVRTCSALCKGLWGREDCVLRIVVGNILTFFTEEHQKKSVTAADITAIVKGMKGK